MSSGLKTATIAPTNGVKVEYKGSATLTISPAAGNVSQLLPGHTVSFPPNENDYALKFGEDTIATVKYPTGGASASIVGGSYHEASGPIYLHVQLDV